MNSDFSYLASKCFNLTSKNWSKSCTCLRVSLSVQYLMQSHNWIDFGIFFSIFFVSFLQGKYKKRMRTCKSILTPTTEEPKICHALATTSAFHLKLCRIATFFCHVVWFTSRVLQSQGCYSKLQLRLQNYQTSIIYKLE